MTGGFKMDNEKGFTHFLLELLFDYSEGLINPEFNLVNLQTFDQAGISDRNVGLLAQINDGSEYQITVVQSK